MQVLLSLIGSIATGEATDALARARRAAATYLLAAILLVLGLVFLLIAAFIASARKIGALEASLWFGGGFLVVGLLIVLIHRLASKARARRIARKRQSEIKSVVSAAAVALVPALLASRTGSLAILAPLAATLGYGVWKENSRRRPHDRPHQD